MSDDDHDRDDHDRDHHDRAGELMTMLRRAEPTDRHRAVDLDALWAAGHRRARRTRTAWAAAMAAGLVVVAVLAVSTIGRDGDVSIQVADTVPDSELVEPAPGPTAPPDVGSASSPGFPVSVRIDRNRFVAGGDPMAEVGLVPTDLDAWAGVTVAIPFTIDTWDATGGAWEPVMDLYDMSRTPQPYWQPHDTGGAWFEWTAGAWGFPVRLPVEDLVVGNHRLCVQAWRTEDGAPRPDDGAIGGEARSLSELEIPGSSVHLCVPIELTQMIPAQPIIPAEPPDR